MTALNLWKSSMEPETSAFDHVRRRGESAMHPIAPRSTRHAALLGLAGMSPPRSPALPGTPITAHSGASNCFF
ncbi:hypothetical protein [Variovorax rhizosphaerae]|uniref:Uncharacterized protein n=1 Tax=Variovorax rhizosphaerae TaxID=1836200 RepID=A0ABU8WKW6_9BURK